MENNKPTEIDPKKVENLHKILAVFDEERLTSKDFIEAFKQVINHVKSTQDLTVQHLQTITTAVNDAAVRLDANNRAHLSTLHHELSGAIDAKHAIIEQRHNEAFSRLDEAIANIHQGVDADEDVIVEKVLAKIPPLPPTPIGEDFRNHLEALQGDDRLDKSAIRGLEELEKKIDNHSVVIGNTPGTGLANSSGNIGRFQYLKFPGATINTVDDTATITVAAQTITTYTETPSGIINGSNPVFTTAHSINTVFAFAINGQFIHPADYTVAGSNITFGSPLPVELSGTPFTIIYA